VEESALQVSSISQHVDPQTVCIDEHVCVWRVSKLVAYVWILQIGEDNIHWSWMVGNS
jgi:hypothetical protein